MRASVLRMTEAQRWARWVELRKAVHEQGGFLLDIQTAELTLLARLLDGTQVLVDGKPVTARAWFTYERVPLYGGPDSQQPQPEQQPSPARDTSTKKERDTWQAEQASISYGD